MDAGSDLWPEIQLARIVLKPNAKRSFIAVALNAPVEQISPAPRMVPGAAAAPKIPKGCVRDLSEDKGEHRRVTFFDEDTDLGTFSVGTEIVHVPDGAIDSRAIEKDFEPDPEATIGKVPFERYEQRGNINWEAENPKHVCVKLQPGGSSHKQLWVLANQTGDLHNFHIHQMKFRLATREELCRDYHITPPVQWHSCGPSTGMEDTCKNPPSDACEASCNKPDFKFYEEPCKTDPKGKAVWHDTIPVPKGKRVFLVMSFDADQQVGRFVFHCHVLKHEDNGLMAPIEVWKGR